MVKHTFSKPIVKQAMTYRGRSSNDQQKWILGPSKPGFGSEYHRLLQRVTVTPGEPRISHPKEDGESRIISGPTHGIYPKGPLSGALTKHVFQTITHKNPRCCHSLVFFVLTRLPLRLDTTSISSPESGRVFNTSTAKPQ